MEAEELRSHLAERYGFGAHTLYTLGQDVFLLRRGDRLLAVSGMSRRRMAVLGAG